MRETTPETHQASQASQAMDERLRAALRDGDPAAGDALTAAEASALRRAMLAASEAAERRQWPCLPPAPALAAAAAAIGCVVLALGLWRMAAPDLTGGRTDQVGKEVAGGSGETHPGAEPGRRQPHRPPASGTERPLAGSRRASAAAPSAAGHEEPATSTAAPPPTPFLPTQPAASTAKRAPTAPPSTSAELAALAAEPEPAQPGAVPITDLAVVPEREPELESELESELVLAAAAPLAEEVLGLQLQFSAPGGTRILWTLTSPQGE